MPGPRKPSIDEVRENAGLSPLTPRMRRDAEYRRRVDERDGEHSEVDRANSEVLEATRKKVDINVQEAADQYNAKVMGNAIIQQMQLRDDQERAKDLADQKAYLDGINREADELSRARVDSRRLFANQTTGDKVTAFLMSMAGGFSNWGSPGSNHNPYVEGINRLVQQDIDDQKGAIENRKASIVAKRGLLGDMQKLYGDREAARLATEAHMKESIANRYEEITARYGADRAQAQGDATIAQLRKEAAEARFTANEMVWNRLQSERAAATHAPAAQANKASERRWELLKEQNKEAYAALKQAQADGTAPPPWALRALSLDPEDAPKANPAGGTLTKEQRGKMAMEKEEKTRSADAQDAQIDRMLQSPVVTGPTRGAALPGVGTGIGQRIAPGSAQDLADIQSINADINAMGGKAIKDNEGRVPPVMLEQLHNFNLAPGDTPEMKQRKIQNFKTWLHDRQTETGAREAEAPKAKPADSDPYAKYRVK